MSGWQRTRVYKNHHLDSTRWDSIEPRDDDVVITTSYKAGTTWTQGIVASLLLRDIPDAPNPLMASPWVDARFQAPLPVLIEALKAQTHRRFMKSHLAADGLPYRPTTRYIVVARDARDVFMSLVNHYAGYTDTRDGALQRRPEPRAVSALRRRRAQALEGLDHARLVRLGVRRLPVVGESRTHGVLLAVSRSRERALPPLRRSQGGSRRRGAAHRGVPRSRTRRRRHRVRRCGVSHRPDARARARAGHAARLRCSRVARSASSSRAPTGAGATCSTPTTSRSTKRRSAGFCRRSARIGWSTADSGETAESAGSPEPHRKCLQRAEEPGVPPHQRLVGERDFGPLREQGREHRLRFESREARAEAEVRAERERKRRGRRRVGRPATRLETLRVGVGGRVAVGRRQQQRDRLVGRNRRRRRAGAARSACARRSASAFRSGGTPRRPRRIDRRRAAPRAPARDRAATPRARSRTDRGWCDGRPSRASPRAKAVRTPTAAPDPLRRRAVPRAGRRAGRCAAPPRVRGDSRAASRRRRLRRRARRRRVPPSPSSADTRSESDVEQVAIVRRHAQQLGDHQRRHLVREARRSGRCSRRRVVRREQVADTASTT